MISLCLKYENYFLPRLCLCVGKSTAIMTIIPSEWQACQPLYIQCPSSIHIDGNLMFTQITSTVVHNIEKNMEVEAMIGPEIDIHINLI